MKKIYKILISFFVILSLCVICFIPTVSADEYDYERYSFDTLSTAKQYVFYGYANDLPTLINSVENTSFTTLYNSIADRLSVTVLDDYVQYNYLSPYDITASYGYFSMCFYDDRIDTGYDINLFERIILNSAYFNYYSLNSEILGYRFSIRPYSSNGTIGAVTHTTPWMDSYLLNTEFVSNQLFSYYTPVNIYNQTFNGNDLPIQYVICVDFLFQPVLGFEGQSKQVIALDLDKYVNGSITAYYQPDIDQPTQPLYPELNSPYYEQSDPSINEDLNGLQNSLVDEDTLADRMADLFTQFNSYFNNLVTGVAGVTTLLNYFYEGNIPFIALIIWSLTIGVFAFIVGLGGLFIGAGMGGRSSHSNYRSSKKGKGD